MFYLEKLTLSIFDPALWSKSCIEGEEKWTFSRDNLYIGSMKNISIYLFLCCFWSGIAQERPAAFAAVEAFFDAFHAKDSVVLQNSFTKNARLLRSTQRDGQPKLIENDIAQFVRAVAQRKDSPQWEERLGKPIVQQHLNLATVWVPFHFYLDNKLSHCGFNAFTLVWDNSSWKIMSLVDTGTKECDMP